MCASHQGDHVESSCNALRLCGLPKDVQRCLAPPISPALSHPPCRPNATASWWPKSSSTGRAACRSCLSACSHYVKRLCLLISWFRRPLNMALRVSAAGEHVGLHWKLGSHLNEAKPSSKIVSLAISLHLGGSVSQHVVFRPKSSPANQVYHSVLVEVHFCAILDAFCLYGFRTAPPVRLNRGLCRSTTLQRFVSRHDSLLCLPLRRHDPELPKEPSPLERECALDPPAEYAQDRLPFLSAKAAQPATCPPSPSSTTCSASTNAADCEPTSPPPTTLVATCRATPSSRPSPKLSSTAANAP
jgi:hypothetical protein